MRVIPSLLAALATQSSAFDLTAVGDSISGFGQQAAAAADELYERAGKTANGALDSARKIDVEAMKEGLADTARQVHRMTPEQVQASAASALAATGDMAEGSIRALKELKKNIPPIPEHLRDHYDGAMDATRGLAEAGRKSMSSIAGHMSDTTQRITKSVASSLLDGAREVVWQATCGSVPCQNSGKCVISAEDDASYVCICDPRMGWGGSNCEVNTVCASEPCFNGGTCGEQATGGFVCGCPLGFGGDRCQTKFPTITPLTPSPKTPAGAADALTPERSDPLRVFSVLVTVLIVAMAAYWYRTAALEGGTATSVPQQTTTGPPAAGGDTKGPALAAERGGKRAILAAQGVSSPALSSRARLRASTPEDDFVVVE